MTGSPYCLSWVLGSCTSKPALVPLTTSLSTLLILAMLPFLLSSPWSLSSRVVGRNGRNQATLDCPKLPSLSVLMEETKR
ncbi:uncharacterized protein DS421_16g539720 [Arachis hypogaea]|nr:uncharacterized protein DS421_16g539720 [Arachis hypogaea]